MITPLVYIFAAGIAVALLLTQLLGWWVRRSAGAAERKRKRKKRSP
jgi:hypothetical protein